MPAVYAAGNVWAITPDGNVRYASATTTEWHSVRNVNSPILALTACDSKLAVYVACADGSVHTFDAATAQHLLTAPDPQHARPLCMLALPTDDSLYIGLEDGALVRLHLSTLQFDCILGCGVEHKAPVTALDMDDQYVFSAGQDGVILVWDPKEGNAVREMSMPSDPISSILRVDAALWVGLSTGAVEVYDIFGDDTNGIECISNKTPHNSSVTNLLRVGHSEVWSIAAVSPTQTPSHASNPNIAVWDTRDFSYVAYDEVNSKDLMSVAIIDRSAFENVSLLMLTNTLGQKLVTTQVRDTLPRGASDDEDSMDELVSDLENQLVQANEEINRLRQTASQHPRTLPMLNLRLPRHSLSPQSRREIDHTNCDETCDDHLCPVRLQKEYYDFSGESTVDEIDPLVITGSVSETINTSLNKVSELLVSLLADDVLTPEDNVRGNNEVLRTAVANITRELNVSKNLVDRCTVLSENNKVHVTTDSNQPLASSNSTQSVNENIAESSTNQQSTDENSSGSESQNEQAARLLQVEKDLALVTRERDVLCEDLNQLRTETESTMTALEEIIEDKSSKIKERDDLIIRLRRDCRTAEKRFENERALRSELKENLETQLDELSKAADETSKTFEEQLFSAYDKIETKSIEVQSQREVLHTAEQKLEALRSANQNLESKYNQLEEQLAESVERTDEVAREFATRVALCDREYQVEIDAAKKKHSQELETLQKISEELRRKLKVCQEESRKEKQRAYLELQSVKDERDQRVDDFNQSLTQSAEMERRHQNMVTKLETEIQELKSRFNSERDKLERCLRECQQTSEVERLAVKEENQRELQRLNSLIDDLRTRLNEALSKNTDTSSLEEILRAELKAMTEERELLLKEVEHREAAQKHFESEAENLQSAISDLRLANDELQHLLDEKEAESASFLQKVEELRLTLRSRELRLQQLEGTTNGLNTQYEETGDVSDTQRATKAILASASGEMEQLTQQIDAMNRAYTAQERELNELREALSTRDDMIRLRNSLIDNLTKQRDAVEPLSSPGLSLNLSPDDPPSTGTNNRKLSLSKSSLTTVSPGNVDASEQRIVCDALQEIQDGMNLTQDKLRELTSTARRYKRFAQSHLDVLPALHELEGELIRVTTAEPQKNNSLASAQGIVQSLIAQYYTNSQKRALLKSYDENLYRPSSERLEALHKAIARLRKLRTGSEEVVFQHIDDVPNEVLISKPEKPIKAVDDILPSTRRLLTFN